MHRRVHDPVTAAPHARHGPLTPRQDVRKAVMALARWCGSSTEHSSRAECIDRIAAPPSTVAMPCRAAVIGPIVVPHGTALLETNGCHGTPARSHAARNRLRPLASVA